MKWEEGEIEFLIQNYENNSNKYLSEYLNKPINSIIYQASKFKLKKSESYIKEMMINRNKKMGRDLSVDKLTKIAKKYKTRGEFQREDGSAYTTARIKGILDNICEHMMPQSYSIPQLICKYIFDTIIKSKSLYNTRKIIPPYELDIYYPKYKLGIEYNGKGWHGEKDNTKIKKEMCEKLKINLLIIKENSRKYEEDIKSQIIENLSIINNQLEKNIKKSDINDIKINDQIYNNILDEKYIKSVISKYDKLKDFREKERRLYQKIVKLGLLNKFTGDLTRSSINWNLDKLKKTISKYCYLQDLIENDYGCYQYIKKNNLEYLIKKLKYKRKNDLRNHLFDSKMSLEEYAKFITSKYVIYKEFRINEQALYRKLIKEGILKKYTSHME